MLRWDGGQGRILLPGREIFIERGVADLFGSG